MNGKLLKCASCKDRDALLTFYDVPAEPPAISGGAGLELTSITEQSIRIIMERHTEWSVAEVA